MAMTTGGATASGAYGNSGGYGASGPYGVSGDPGAPGAPGAGSPGSPGSVAERGRGRLRSGFGLIGPRHGRHSLSAEQVDSLALPIGDDGVVIGVDAEGQPAVLGLNRPTPYDVVLIGGLWTAQVLALRAAATGARVAVETGRAPAWMQMVHAMGGGQNGMSVHDVGRVPPQGSSAGNPVLVVRDCGMRPPRGRVVSGPWQSVLTLLPYLSPVAPRLLRQARLVGVQRVSPDEAAEIGRALTLPRGDVDSLPTLADGVTLWCADRDRQYVMTQPTDAETGLFGTPRRMD
ncbi:hypothetical protein [Streptomyces sp. NBC_01483]|uniref:hypothetical protein n=1 Tax=Streptomyces sp. NBC_01483 TaxID=2903883 RepID=UPI003FCC3081